ncbi:MAG: bifunctional folylpolyglutamate synthase/dihydrofolate synthase [Peptostreptococcaceae bacterium]|nr:bifunctional folylpolyglutamate synthase/dihydrofolate synthase [Peptostreptococcaceae bacterium]
MNAIEKICKFEKFGSVLGLERIQKLMELLGNPEKKLKIVHIAGTNGKGSVSRYIYEGLRANGYNVGLFTSPFLQIFNERIEFDGEYINDNELEELTDTVLEKCSVMVELGLDSPTEFEVVTAIAFLFFLQKQADFVVLEVGLGGRGDSTNIIENPLISIIASISYDHMDRLGSSLEEIAFEKAGIIKKGVPVLINVKDQGAAKVIAKKAYEMNAVLFDATKIKTNIKNKDLNGSNFDMNVYGTDYSEIEITMVGEHQIENAKVALIAIELLRKTKKINVERSRLYAGIKNARQSGRFEVLNTNPWIIIDGAHNKAGAEALVKVIEENFPNKKILFVVGILEDKDADGIISQFCSVAREFISTEPDNIRKMTAEKLCDIINDNNGSGKVVKNVKDACDQALSLTDEFDVVVFAGSLYLVGEIRGILKNEHKS